MSMRAFRSLLGATILLLALSAPAFAQTPTHTTFTYPDIYDFDCGEYGFDYTLHFDDLVTVRQTTFYSPDGSVEREQLFFGLTGAITNLETGTTFRDQGASGVTVFPSATVTEHGVGFHLTLPGEGLVVLRVGTVIYDWEGNILFVSGQNRELDYKAHACELLEGI